MKRLQFLACLSLAFMIGCSEAPKKATETPKEPEKPAEPVGGLSALQQMWIRARAWAPDAQAVRLANLTLSQVKNQDGKAGAWEGTFVSQSRRRARRYTYSVMDVPPANLTKGVQAGIEETWAPGGQTRPFPIPAVKTDSSAAYQLAVKKGGADYAQKHPDMPVQFVLETTKRFPGAAWRVLWGESVSTSNFSVFVDAADGKYLQTAR